MLLFYKRKSLTRGKKSVKINPSKTVGNDLVGIELVGIKRG